MWATSSFSQTSARLLFLPLKCKHQTRNMCKFCSNLAKTMISIPFNFTISKASSPESFPSSRLGAPQQTHVIKMSMASFSRTLGAKFRIHSLQSQYGQQYASRYSRFRLASVVNLFSQRSLNPHLPSPSPLFCRVFSSVSPIKPLEDLLMQRRRFPALSEP